MIRMCTYKESFKVYIIMSRLPLIYSAYTYEWTASNRHQLRWVSVELLPAEIAASQVRFARLHLRCVNVVGI